MPLDVPNGDCVRAACTEDGEVYNDVDLSDVPRVGECMIGICDPKQETEIRPDGTACSDGVCAAGVCVASDH